MTGTSPADLWYQAKGDREEYLRLMRQHGHIVKCECPCHEDGSGHCEQCRPRLACGWPHPASP